MDNFYEAVAKRGLELFAQLDYKEVTIGFYSGDEVLINELNMLLDFFDNISYKRFIEGIEVWPKGERVSEMRIDPKLKINTGRQLIESWVEQCWITKEEGMKLLENLLEVSTE